MASSATNLVLAAIVLSSCLAFSRCEDCPLFHCGKYRNLTWPFANAEAKPLPDCHPKFVIEGCEQPSQQIGLGEEPEKWYDLLDIYPDYGRLLLQDGSLSSTSDQCEAFNTSLPEVPGQFSWKNPIIPLLRCNRTNPALPPPLSDYHYDNCTDYDIYYNQLHYPPPAVPPQPPHNCTIIHLPLKEPFDTAPLPPIEDLPELIATEFYLESCDICTSFGGKCQQCKGGREARRKPMVIGLAIGLPAVAILLFCAFYVFRRYRQKSASSGFLPTKTNSDPSWKTDFERDGAYFGVPVFSYSELEEATNCFDPTRELGEGGFGAVYYGQLRDGREVAVKRLYENNCKRVQQFMNEIKILTGLRHKNLVTLYGCTSRHSRELLLVYEFISNGTVADHLHGDRSAPTPLAWPVRLRIAVETANALTYLHASGIIHRDIKTSNILLDNNFCVKVADFGLSRLFPSDVTHVSTAPQGTPGYVDPEYHMCYQLTERSDVYSFGVVLIELISSLPAVDICRDRKEINLANLAVNRIRNREYSEFLDPCLRFESDLEVKRTVLMVAELAYQCLQRDREQRPSMEEALSTLKGIQGDHDNDAQPTGDNRGNVQRAPAWLESEDGVLVKRTHFLTSPVSVTDKWVSGSTPTAIETRIVTV